MILAVDGPAASGKGTIARALAAHFGLPHMDTGLIYRAAAFNLLELGLDPDSEFQAARACAIEQVDLSDPALKSETVGGIASRISAYPLVREALLERQQRFAAQLLERQQRFAAQEGGAVLDGRDIGTVIAPHARVKLFVTAAPEIRARRRHAELRAQGLDVHLAEMLADIRARDERDSGRDAAPLVMAADAILIDTSALAPDQAIAEAIAKVEARLA